MLQKYLAPFKKPNIRYFLAGEILFFLAYWVSYINMIILTYQVTHSPKGTGILGFAVNIPLPLALPFAGVIADRLNRKRILWIIQVCCLLPSIYLGYATITHHINFPILLAVAFFYGLFFAIANPSAYAMINDMVEDPNDLHKVIAITSSNLKSTQFISAALNSILHFVLTLGQVFFAAAIGHVAALLAYLRIDYKRPEHIKHDEHPVRQLIEGFKYVFHFAPYRSLLLEVGIGCTTVGAYLFQLPFFAEKVMHSTTHGVNALYLVGGIGGIFGGVLMSLRRRSQGVARICAYLVILMGACFIGFSQTTHSYTLLAYCFVIDACIVAILGGTTTTMQLIVEKAFMGRVMSIIGLVTFGFIAIGSAVFGFLASKYGTSVIVAVAGGICIAIALFYLSRLKHYHEMLKPVYEKFGLSKERQPI